MRFLLLKIQLMLCGMQEIDVDDWAKHTVYKTYVVSNQEIIWFWQVSFPQDLHILVNMVRFGFTVLVKKSFPVIIGTSFTLVIPA